MNLKININLQKLSFWLRAAVLKNENKIFEITTDKEFRELCLQVFRYQYENNSVYKLWVDMLGRQPSTVNEIEAIPFLPIEFFKTFNVVSSPVTSKSVSFKSSSTTSQIPSVHFVNDISLYEKSFLTCFEKFYGSPADYCFLALLPNYLQRKGSSLVYMCDKLIGISKHPDSGFFLDNIEALKKTIRSLSGQKQKVLLIGVSYALMDLCDSGIELTGNFLVMETGGMKGRRKELLKEELHEYLKRGFKINEVHSEYGMTELLSQAYSKGNGRFLSPPWLRFFTREISDPLKLRNDERTGGINVIDLANVNSCSFIATQDLGRVYKDGSLELMGRFNESDVRGCNLMMEDFS